MFFFSIVEGVAIVFSFFLSKKERLKKILYFCKCICSKMKSVLKGTGVALVTPFKEDRSIDFEGIAKMVKYLIANNIDYIVALGTTAETPTLSFAERKQVLETIVEEVNNRVPIVVGIGCNNPIEVNEQIHMFDLSKVSAILSVAPYYNRPQQRGLVEHYRSIAAQSPLPIILYNVPSRTGVNIDAATTLQITATIPNVIGIKEASGNIGQIMQIIANRPKDFLVISGDDLLTLPLLACGVDGVISVVANSFPKEVSAMVNYGLQGNFEQARAIHYQLMDPAKACFADGSPSGIKCFLHEQGLIGQHVRLPLADATEEMSARVRKLLNR